MRNLRQLTSGLCLLCIVEVAAGESANEFVSDPALATTVRAALATDHAVNARDIKVDTRDGLVILSGTVESAAARTAAVARARSVLGTTDVRDELSVRPESQAPQESAADTVIAAQVRSSLDNAAIGDGSNVNVEVSAGVVQLSGFVTNADGKTRAENAASSVSGVRDVESSIRLLESR
ncbi:BON domain-containing protein [Steroidobacter flavus]|uniref:BON domain-containing protein n=1 Tax=Steroidobacter flavus TaxID=1842136 RepID=A0ABV8SYX7_9GAMM